LCLRHVSNIASLNTPNLFINGNTGDPSGGIVKCCGRGLIHAASFTSIPSTDLASELTAFYQGRFQSFRVRSDEQFLPVCRCVKRNALRANLVERAEEWKWSSLAARRAKADEDRPALTPWPIERPRDWMARVNRAFGPKEEEAIGRSIERGQAFGSATWQASVAVRVGLESLFRPQGRPRKQNGS
jgi:hypothetical protein